MPRKKQKYSFSRRSKKKLREAHPLLQEIFHEVIKIIDCSVLEGHRGKDAQNRIFERGESKLRWPRSKHNKTPSLAVDVVPYPIDWNDRESFLFFAGIVKGVAHSKGIKIRWGGDWNSNNNFKDQSFHDLPHFELVGVRK